MAKCLSVRRKANPNGGVAAKAGTEANNGANNSERRIIEAINLNFGFV
jgi:hypothetical protein